MGKKTKFRSNNTNKNIENKVIKDKNDVISADECRCWDNITIRQRLIWLEEIKIFFYNIKHSYTSNSGKENERNHN